MTAGGLAICITECGRWFGRKLSSSTHHVTLLYRAAAAVGISSIWGSLTLKLFLPLGRWVVKYHLILLISTYLCDMMGDFGPALRTVA